MNTTLKMSPLICRVMPSSYLRAFQGRENPHSPLTQFLLKGSDAMLNHFQLTRASFLDKWINQMLILSKVFHLLFLSTRNPRIETRVRQSERLPRCMTTSDSYTHVLDDLIVLVAVKQSPNRLHKILLTKSLLLRPELNFRF